MSAVMPWSNLETPNSFKTSSKKNIQKVHVTQQPTTHPQTHHNQQQTTIKLFVAELKL